MDSHGHMDSIKYQQIKNQQVIDSVRNIIMGHVWIFQPYNNPNPNLKNNTKMGHLISNEMLDFFVNADTFSQPSLIIFTKGADILGHDCIYNE